MSVLVLAQSFERAHHGVTTLHPLGVVMVVVLGCALLAVPRTWAVVPFLVLACFVAYAQRIVIAGLDFNLLRVLILFGLARIVLNHEYRGFRWQRLDVVMLAWVFSGASVYVMQQGNWSAVVNRAGWAYDAIGLYFLFRCFIRGWEDVYRISLAFAVISLPVAAAFVFERATGRNMFSIFGGVPEITRVREGRLRCQGAFSHAILAGCFWAAVLPLIAARWWNPSRWAKELAVLGVLASLAIVVLCASATPVAAVGFAAVAAVLFPLRPWMWLVRIGTVAALVGLHFVMTHPVWHLLTRTTIVGGNTGWHRYTLVDGAIRHFDEWAILGTQSTAHWGRGLFDVTNQYILEGVRGGLSTLVLFVLGMWLAFAAVGQLWRGAQNRAQEVMAWALGVSLFVHATSFIGVSYFGQITMLWYLALALPVSLVAAGCAENRVAAGALHPHNQL